MKYSSLFLLTSLSVVMGLTFSSCNKKKQDIIPSFEFAPYVSAYTGGVISSNAVIRVELSQEQQIVEMDAEVKEKLFSFSPSLKGRTFWINNKTVAFTPDPGSLKPGECYNAAFALGKVIRVEKKLEKFDFSFRVEERNFKTKITALDVTENAPESVTIRGEIRFSDTPDVSGVSGMITAKRGKDQFIPEVIPTDNDRLFHFVISDVPKEEDESIVKISVSGKTVDVDKTDEESVIIPGLTPFKLLSAEMINEPEYGICLTFSDPVDERQDMDGFVSLDGISNFVSQIQDNKINLFFERKSGTTSVIAGVYEGLKNTNGDPLAKTVSVSLDISSRNPQVEILTSGTIMPDAKKLILPFRAVSLYAVDLKVIRIFESNILLFLQDNTLASSSSSELRRSGRLVYKKMLRLDSDPAKNIQDWDNYFIDLSEIIKQEPGAIYRVELSFKKNYAAYPCGNEPAANNLQESDRMIRVEAGDLTENEEAIWDIPQSYYYDNSDMDWDEYEWEERDNPCHASYYMLSERKASTNILASNLGVIAKANSNNDLWVSVTDLLDTKPVAHAEVTAYNFQLQPAGSAKTDENGFAVIQAKRKPFVLVAVSGNQKAYLRMVDGEENMLSRFDTGGKDIQKGLKGYIYGERGVWRPGDTLHISFMVEDREKRIPDNHPVSIEVYNPRGQFYNKQIAANGLNGLYTFTIPTKADDPTGLWNAYVKVGGTSFHKSLRIETVKPNRLKINLDIPGNRISSANGSMPITVRSAWLTGAAARNLKTKLDMTLSKTATQFKGYENYIFNNPASEFTASTVRLYEGTLDNQGKAAFDIKIPAAKNAPGMLRANILCNVYEQGGDVSIFNQSVPFSPFSAYVGINFNQKHQSGYFETDTENVFDIVTLNADGKPESRSDLEYKIYNVGWSWWWEHDDESFASYINNSSIRPVASGEFSTIRGKGQIKFKVDYPDWGRYLVYVKDRESEHATGGTVYVDWPDWRGRSNKSDPSGIKMLPFSLDKSEYEAGEVATVIIPSSAGGRALVAIENGSDVISREWVAVSSSEDTKYKFKITEHMAPNVYVHISLLQPHEQTVNDLPIRMYGVMPVFVTNKASLLKPQIAMTDVLHPDTEFTVKIKEANGAPMTYTLAVVDDGLLDLTNFKTPDPWHSFYAREALGIRTWDMYDLVIGAFAGKYGSLFSIGGDEDAVKPATRANRFKPVVKFAGPFALKKGEEKAHKLQLPSYIGSVRVMVVAGQNGAYGNAEKTVPVRTPLMILSSLPGVISTDEEIALPVNIFAMENSVKNVSVKVETSGKLQLTGGNSKSLAFTNPGDETVYFTLKSGTETGVETITVTATGNGQTSKETIEIDIRNPNPPIVYFENKLLNAGESADFNYRLDGSYNENWVKLETSRIPSVDISRRFDFLSDYQHLCSEQLTSGALPLLFISQFKEIDKKENELIRKNVRAAITDLYGRQMPNGGMMYWPGNGYVDEWITSYAGTFLIWAKEKGYDVNAGVLNRWKNYQRSAAQNWRSGDRNSRRYDYSQSDLEQAYRLYSLALAGAPEMGAMNRLKEMKDLSQQAKWRLAAAYALAGKKKAAGELIFNLSADVEPYALSNSTYGSSDRDEAMILETLVLMGRDKEAFIQAQKVSGNLTRETHFSTQSTACSLVAMAKLAEQMSGSQDFDWTLNGSSQPTVKSAKAVFQKDIPVKPASGNITVKNTGKGVLYVNLVSKTKPLRDSFPAVQNNIRLDVHYTDMNGSAMDVAKLKQGTDFIAVIKVSNISGRDNYTDLALTQMIPSGWEIYNERMVNPDEGDTDRSTPFNWQDIRDDRVLTYFDLGINQSKIFKIRLMASYAGSFVFPAIQCEAMYDTNVQARTKADRVIVEK
ncbi:MAG: alpha-2-macroglobulin [Tannerella sp.]|nr:alpha-2-macroglobulin [Tannerella sp.]